MQPTLPLLPPRFQGFARSPGESAYPDLWRNLVGLWVPSLGVQGITTLPDWSGLKFNGTLNGSMAGTNWNVGQHGWCLDFDGTDDYIGIGNGSATHPLKPALPVTIIARVKVDQIAVTNAFFVADDGANIYSGYSLFTNSSGQLFANFGDGTGAASSDRRSKTGATALTVGAWHHVVAVIRGATDMSIYLDGKDDAGTNSGTGGAMAYTTAESVIGRLRAPATDVFMNGMIADVFVYARALTSQEIMALYSGASPLTLARRTAGKASGGTAWTLDIADTITFSDALTKSVGAAKTDAITFTDAIAKASGKAASDALSFSDTSTTSSGKNIADAVTFSDASSNAAGKSTSDALSFSDAESNGTGKSASDALSFTDASVYGATKSTSDAISFTDTFAVPGFVTDTLTLSDTVTTSFVAGEEAVCPPDTRYQRRPLGWMAGSGERTAFAEIDCETNKRKPIGFMTPDDTKNPFSPD